MHNAVFMKFRDKFFDWQYQKLSQRNPDLYVNFPGIERFIA